jgi:hypothetical protein
MGAAPTELQTLISLNFSFGQALSNLRVYEAPNPDVQKTGNSREHGLAPKVMAADKGYGSDIIINDIARRGGKAVIAVKRKRKQTRIIDGFVYWHRNLVERCFS